MTGENPTGPEAGESAVTVSAKAVDDQLIDDSVGRAQAEGPRPTGEGGLAAAAGQAAAGVALEGEIADHLGYDKHNAAGRNEETPATANAPRRC